MRLLLIEDPVYHSCFIRPCSSRMWLAPRASTHSNSNVLIDAISSPFPAKAARSRRGELAAGTSIPLCLPKTLSK